MSQCSFCGVEITWKKPFTKGDRPLNKDNSVHTCAKPDTPSTGITTNAITSSTILAEIEAFRIKFGPVESDARFESMAKMWISRMISKG